MRLITRPPSPHPRPAPARRSKNAGGRLAAAAAAASAAELCGLGLAAAAAWMIARAAERPGLAALGFAIIAVRGCAVFKGVFRYGERLLGHDAALRVLADVRVRVFGALARRRSAVRDAAALRRMVAEVEAVQDLLLRCSLPGASAAVAGIAATGFGLLVHPPAGIVLGAGALAAGLVLPCGAYFAARRSGARVAAAADRLAGAGLDLLEGGDELAVNGAAERARAVAAEASAGLAGLERRAARITALADAAGTLVQAATALAVFAVSRQEGTVTAATLTLTALVAVEAVLPLAGAAQRLTTVLPALRSLRAALDSPAEQRPSAPLRLPRGPLPVELVATRVVHPDGRTGLDGVSLRIERGRRIAIVGASGAGKSTLLAAVSGEAASTAGRVLISDAPLEAYAPDEVRRAVRGLTQDAHVFATTIRANLLLARPGATEAELTAAARRARLLEVVGARPGGWDSPATTLSGGERRRLLLARAFLADPGVLLLDEPFEALDKDLADALTRDLFANPAGGTLLLVTHRLAGLAAADEILVLDRGRIAQRGTHDRLRAVPGPYRDLWDAEEFAG